MIKRRFENLATEIIKDLVAELRAQHHENTGALIKSMESRMSVANDSVELEILFNDYGRFVNTGAKWKPGNPPPVKALARWIQERGIATGKKEIINAAFAIRNKMVKEGMPTRNSRSLARRRTGFVDVVVKKNEDKITNLVEDAIFRDFSAQIDNLIGNNGNI